ncbi:MAG: hypothetical protein JSW66_02345 [Phycisphaerales bacterium]|nr:MAG: hypothetical protein JSW66_02345 [Phycisphaerales bacterium]
MKLNKVKKLVKRLHVAPSADMYERTLDDTLRAQENSKKKPSAVYKPNVWRAIVGSRAGGLAAAFLIMSSLVTVLIRSREVTDLRHELELAKRDVTIAAAGDSATINLYLREHQDVVARHASLNPPVQRPLQMRVDQRDILYYEILDDEPEYMRPGIIVRGPSSQREINSSEAPAISNGHTLCLSKAKETTNFDLVAPPWLHPYYKLDQIRTIEDRDALQLLYTDGINSVSLFEQPLDGRRGLESKDFREYAVYRNEGQVGGIILAWRDDVLSYVLIGNIEMSQLMDMAQSISAGK